MKQTNYGNWVPGTLMNLLWGGTALFLAAVLFIRFLGGSGLMQGIFLALFALFAVMALYMQACRHAFSFTGGNVMGNIHRFLLSKLPWDGRGSLLDIGCGSGALAISAPKPGPPPGSPGSITGGKSGITQKPSVRKMPASSRFRPSISARAMRPICLSRTGALTRQ